ncbi:hypothetical protein [Chitinimonas lacunae]|uniref:DUF2029 domain-containing protein n=1 Tax=Chitinimonas lacunae TaxID=1963018 RepID=A0ABV8MTD6_9NEIS
MNAAIPTITRLPPPATSDDKHGFSLIELFFIVLMFLIATVGQDRIENYLSRQYGVPVSMMQSDLRQLIQLKASLFLCALLVLARPVRQQLYKLTQLWSRRALIQSALIMLILYLLSSHILPLNLGFAYQHVSIDPFNQPTNWLYRRLLNPTLAYYLHLDGMLFPIYTAGLSWLSIALVISTLDRLLPGKISFLEKLALATCAFVIYQFQIPGYPDTLVLLLGLMLWQGDLSARAQRLLIVLLLLTHEALGLVVVLSLLPRLQKPVWIITILAAYGACMALNFGFDIEALLRKQSVLRDPTNLYPLEAFKSSQQHPERLLAALLIAYKLAWVSIGRGAMLAWQAGQKQDVWLIVAPIALAGAQMIIASDISRLGGMGFIGVLLSYAWFASRTSPSIRRWWALGQLAIPSFYIASDVGMVHFPGLYGRMIVLFTGGQSLI